MKIKKQNNKILKEEYIDGKTYLFRGESRNNYHNKSKTTLNSRYYSYEAFDNIAVWGKVSIYELLDDSKILNYDDSVEEFVKEYDLLDVKSNLLKKLYGVYSINELEENRSFHDLFHSWQIIATEYLETQTDYDGVIWYEYSDTPEYQVQIWNNSIIRKLSYGEAKKIIAELAKMNPDMYGDDVRNDVWSVRNFELKKK